MSEKFKTNMYRDVPSIPVRDPIDLQTLTGEGSGSVEMEIGFGKGRFILDRAQATPENRLFGIETRRKWVALVETRAHKRQLANVRVFFGDARTVLPRIVPDGCLSSVFIHFPDPWWKARHAKRVLITTQFIEQISRLLEDNGRLFLQTDVDFRAAEYLQTISSIDTLVPFNGAGSIDTNPFNARSPREVACERIGLPIYRMLFVRKKRGE
jgi:tRNA (guanine-N7-)-methyltransferase